jgi:translation initiation factor 4E
VDKMWLYTVGIHKMVSLCQYSTRDEQMLAAIGETFDPSPVVTDGTGSPPKSLITGVIVSTRPQFYRLSIWTRVAPSGEDDGSRERIEGVGKHFKMNVLGYAEGQKLAGPLATEVEFLSHKDSEKKGKAAKKMIV